ncbi:ABC transporter ATP-binding protein [Apilactobacillus timberlakei]|uniref:ABC transporter ATP-binding protein n=1 Tax=Apilactobacillus timberlakei TaxID=2008380 RepID=A0ABY2YSR6_9LACO|nr:ABC transporter ATP-binding protein [Apilactobacillus timberlakei]TPR12315.1 ABC transporter ATP-binding protein [Apilactobacillus timberlakei]TPR12918.1 ABC transporter ATP-binding protein [Apilactobacillus timberlakei]
MIVNFENVSKKIGSNYILENINFDIKKGHVFALLGPNGAGKTTTLRLITGLLSATNGEVKVFGKKISSNKNNKIRQNIGIQNDCSLYEKLTVNQNLKFWGKLYGIDSNKIKDKINELTNIFKMNNKLNSKVSTLSKGMKQKVLIMRAIMHEPRLLILDEPTSGLDPQMIEDVISYLDVLVKKFNTSILMATHQLQGLEDFVDDIAIINSGKLMLNGNAKKLINNRWKNYVYEIDSDHNDIALNICLKYGNSYIKNGKLLTECIKRNEISNISKALFDYGLNIYGIVEHKHTIKDMYFETIKGEMNEYSYKNYI